MKPNLNKGMSLSVTGFNVSSLHWHELLNIFVFCDITYFWELFFIRNLEDDKFCLLLRRIKPVTIKNISGSYIIDTLTYFWPRTRSLIRYENKSDSFCNRFLVLLMSLRHLVYEQIKCVLNSFTFKVRCDDNSTRQVRDQAYTNEQTNKQTYSASL